MNTKTIEQLQQEAEQAAAALRAAKEAQEQAEREAKREEERQRMQKAEQERIAYRIRVMQPIVDRLTQAGFEVEQRSNGNVLVEGHVSIWLEEETRSVSSWRSVFTGRLLLLVEKQYGFNGKHRYPPNKDGKYNLDKIIATTTSILEGVRAEQRRKEEEAKKLRSGEQLAAALKAKLSASKHSAKISGTVVLHYPSGARRYECRTNTPAAGKVFYSVGTLELTPEQVETFNAFLETLFPSKAI